MAHQVQPGSAAEKLAGTLAGLDERLGKIEKGLTAAKSKSGVSPSQLFHATSGPVGQDSRGYSVLRAAALCTGFIGREKAKDEWDISCKLKDALHKGGFRGEYGDRSFLMPYSTANLLCQDEDDEYRRFVAETRQKMCAHQGAAVDPDEVDFLIRKGAVSGSLRKTLGTVSDAAGGVLVGFPTLGELVDLQRNLEVFPAAGATESPLPPNGRIQYPKLTGGSTAYWVGENVPLTSSNPTTGYLDLVAKKLGVLTYINNELFKFNLISAEAMLRTDMARVAALKADLAMLEGSGGTQPLGLINYPSQSSWTVGSDKLLAYTVTSNVFQPKDAANIVELLPDIVQEPTAWVMRRQMWGHIVNRRADAVTTGDGAGPFVFWTARGDQGSRPAYELYGTKVVRSSQVSATRSSSKTYVLCGYFPDWIIARAGVLEFLASNTSDTAMTNDQTLLRGIQYIDAGARHPASFVFADNVNLA